MSLAQPCLWVGQQPVSQFWAAPCCAAPAQKTCEDSNITVNHSLPQPGSTSKSHPLSSSHPTREHRTRLATLSVSYECKLNLLILHEIQRPTCLHTCNYSHRTMCVGTGARIIIQQDVFWCYSYKQYEQTSLLFHVNHPINLKLIM